MSQMKAHNQDVPVLDQTIEYNHYNPSVGRQAGGYNVYEHGEYPSSSVLAGYPSRNFLGYFDTVAEAQEAHPQARVIQGSTRMDIQLPHTPPAWFDSLDAGERWDDNY